MATRRLTTTHSSRRRPVVTQPRLRTRLRRRALPVLLVLAGAGSLAIAGTVLWWSRDLPDPQGISTRQVVESTKIFDRTGTHLLYEIGEIRRTAIKLDQVSSNLINATLAAEDDQFYEHHGLDFKGVIRGVIIKPLTGQRAQGGSTITQQLIKNSILTPERTVRRKVKEAVLALELEQRFSKDEILEMYLNEIPYGSQAYGIEAAAQTFFARSAADLTLAQAAILASLPKAPSYYSPYGSRFEDLKYRQESVIQRMAELDMITAEEADAAKAEELDFQPRAESIIAPHFVFYVKEQLDAEYGERVVEQGGLRVITTLDMDLHNAAEAALDEQTETINNLGASNAALVSLDPKTGDVLTMVGSINYFDEEIDGNVNVAIRYRSPGSSIKPFIYTAAWAKGYTPDTILFDAETDFGQDYRPKNYDLAENGPVSMRHALANSMNIPAVKTLYLAGVNEATELARRMGMSSLTDPDRYGLSLVLGGGEVTLLEEVSAYGVFANEGVRHTPRAILKVESTEETLFDAGDNELTGTEIIPPELARLTTSVVSDNNARAASFGTNSPLQLGSRPVAAKTGTTQDFRDGWTIGFTPTLATGVWVGNNDNTPMNSGAAGARTAAPIWNKFMRRALEGTPIEQFVDPETTDEPRHPVLRGEISEVKGRWDPDTNAFYATNCPISLGRPATFKEARSILFYVQRDNPNSDPPAHAEADPQYQEWEDAITTWRNKHNEEHKNNAEEPQYTDSLPTPECTNVSSEDLPRLTITTPDSDIVRTSPIDVDVDIDSPQPLKEVKFMFGGQEVARRGPDGPFSTSLSFPSDFSGRKTLQVIAITEDNLVGRASRNFIINPDDTTPQVSLLAPKSGKTFQPTSFPLTAKVTAKDPSGIELVDVFFTQEDKPGIHRIGRTRTIVPTAPDRFEVTWGDSPGPGTYEVWAVTYDKTGNPGESSRHTVVVN